MHLWIPVLVMSLVVLTLMAANTLGWPKVTPGVAARPGSVSLLIPARNEEANIARALESALEGSRGILEALVYDDHSADRTAERVRDLAARDPRVRLIPPQPLPDGWCGKPFACSRLAAEARGAWLLFLDADAVMRPGAADAAAAEAERRGVTFLSCWPGLELSGFWEKVFMPMLNFVVFTLFPAPLSLSMHLPALGLAHGACILMRAEEYRRTGGHAMVRGELFEDTALARAWRRAGLRGVCLDGRELITVRMYDSLGAIWTGFQKNAYPAFRREASFWLFLAFHAAVFILPFAGATAGAIAGRVLWPAWTAAAAVLASRALQAVRFGYPPWSALLHPVAECGLIAVALTSWAKCRAGRGIEWKGRTYRGHPS